MKLNIAHKTEYSFEYGLLGGIQQIRKTPVSSNSQNVSKWSLSFIGAKHELEFVDQFNNHVNLISIEPGTRNLIIECSGCVIVTDKSGILGDQKSNVPLWLWTEQTKVTKPGAKIKSFAKALSFRGDINDFHMLMTIIRETLKFKKNSTDVGTTAEEAFKLGTGVCQDFTNIFLSCCRFLGYPARYVSGFLLLEDNQVQEAMHAWAEVFIVGLGWVGFDAVNAMSPDDRYVKVAHGQDYADAAPIRGMSFGGKDKCITVSIMVSEQ